MTCSSTSTWGSHSSECTSELKLVPNPTTTSILGDVSFIDDKRALRRVLNIFDPVSCGKAGIESLKLTHELKDYIKDTPLNEVLVQTSPHATFQIFANDDFARYFAVRFLLIVRMLKADSRPVWEKPIALARESKHGVIVHPSPNTITTIVVAGPRVSTRKLQLDHSILTRWLQMYALKLGRAGRKAMKIYPSDDRSRTMCLCLTEILAESWHTFLIKMESKPSPVAIGWKPAQNGQDSGLWEAIDLPDSMSGIVGGSGNAYVRSLQTFWQF